MKRLLLALCLLPSLSWAQTAYESHVINLYAPTVFYYDTETSGTTLTNHGNAGTPSNYNMTTVNTPTLNQSGVTASRGGAIQWASASSQYAHVNRNDTGSGPGDLGSDRTVECWMNYSAANYRAFGTASSEAASSNDVWLIAVNGSNVASFVIFQDGTNLAKYAATGATTLSTGTWYLITGTWAQSTHTLTVYKNGVSDGTSSTDNGGTIGAVQWWEQGRVIRAVPLYSDGKSQDCAVYGSVSPAANILDRYNFGILASIGQTWPFLTKRPDIPSIRDDGWLEKVKSRGYMDGHFTPQAKEPLWLTVGWLPFSTLPPGNVR